MSRRRTESQWLGRTLAGLLLGLAIALVASGLFAWFGPGGIMGGPGKTQFNMWLIAPVWVFILSAVFLFPSTLSAWLWLGSSACLLTVLLVVGRFLTGTL